MRRLLSWALYHYGMFLLSVSERLQGEGRGPWGDPFYEVEGNQFVAAEFRHG